MKRAADKKERRARAFRGSRHNNEVACQPQRNAARHRASRKAARENRKKERHRRGHNSSDAIVVAAPEPKTPEPLLFRPNHTRDVACAVLSAVGLNDGRPYSLRSIDSHDLTGVRPAFRLSDKSGTHGILEYIFPFFGVVLVAAQKMIVKSWLPEGREFLASNLQRFGSHREQSAIESALQSLDPPAQRCCTTDSEAHE